MGNIGVNIFSGNADTLDGKHASDFLPGASYTTISNISINDLIEPGAYGVYTGSTPDCPTGYGTWGLCDVRRYGAVCIQIIYFDARTIIHRARVIEGSDWSAWEAVNDGGHAIDIIPSNGHKVGLWVDDEGGNLQLISPDGNRMMQMDLYNNECFRIYFTDNGAITASPFIYDFANKEIGIRGTVSKALGGYTYVVDSDAALLAWANNVEGNDYTHVLVKRGTWTLSEVPGINLTQAGTKTVTGEPGNQINVSYGAAYEGTDTGFTVYGMYYTNLPAADSGTFVKGINIKSYVNASTSASSPYPVRSSICMYNIRNISQCSICSDAYFTGKGINICVAALDCYQINNTSVKASAYAKVTGLSGCSYISNSTIFAGSGNTATACLKTNYISNCNIATSASSGSYCLQQCDYIDGCYCTISGSGNAIYKCNQILNTFVSQSTVGTGFANSHNIINCVYHNENSSTSGMVGFTDCTRVHNSRCEMVGRSTNAVLFFSNCKGVLGCRAISIGTSYLTYTFNNSYADMSGAAGYECADTPNGGWNYSEVSSS